MASWDEVKRLAADFQKIQLSSTSQKLSERNCIEIVSWLIDKRQIELIFTNDGKEYLTPSQLLSDIRGELYDNGGRIALVELAKVIGVDLAHVNNYLNEVLRSNRDVQCVLGQLVDSSYISKIAGEINEKLSQQGQINVGDLTIQYDLPAEFLQQQVLEKNLGKVIFGRQDEGDPRVFFTESFIARTKAKIRGALAGLTRPTSVASIVGQIEINEKIFFSLFDQTAIYGTLTGRISGARYIPNVYARSQNEWVTNFYKQNGYIEYDALSKLGITDQKLYLKKQFGNEDVIYLNSCIASRTVLDRLEADVDECISSKSYIDLQTELPSIFNEKDTEQVLNSVLSGPKRSQVIVIDNYVLSKAFVEQLSNHCDELVKVRAKEVVDSGKYQQYQVGLETIAHSRQLKREGADTEEKVDRKEERRRKAAGGKSGGGTQGRETKTRAVKKGGRGGRHGNDNEDEDDAVEKRQALVVVKAEDLKGVIQPVLEEENLEELLESIAGHLLSKLNDRGVELASEIYRTTVADRTANRRQTHNELQNKLNALVGDVRLFEKGSRLLPGDLQPQLSKYLLKTLCTDVASEILNYVAAERNLNVSTDGFNNEQRSKFVNDLPAEFRAPLLSLVKSLTGQSIEDFMSAVEESLAACSMIIKKIDRKKDRTVVLNHKHQLLEELNKCEDLALVLHLAVLVIFTTATQCMVHASGRHVAGLLTFLKQYVNEGHMAELTMYHDFVTLMLSGGTEAENAKEKLKEKVDTIKAIANEFKRPGTDMS